MEVRLQLSFQLQPNGFASVNKLCSSLQQHVVSTKSQVASGLHSIFAATRVCSKQGWQTQFACYKGFKQGEATMIHLLW